MFCFIMLEKETVSLLNGKSNSLIREEDENEKGNKLFREIIYLIIYFGRLIELPLSF